MEKRYDCQIYYAMKGFRCVFSVFILLSILLIFITKTLGIPPLLGTIIWICLLLSPFFLAETFKNFFTKRAFLGFDNQVFSITTINLKNDDGRKEMEYYWHDIKAYKFYFTTRKITYLDLYLKNGSHKKIGFKDNKTEEESINQESVFSLFRSFIKQYNSDKQQTDKINLKAGFLTTKTGTFILFCTGILILIAIVIHIIKDVKSIPFLLIGIGAFIPLVLKRRQDKKFYEKMSKLE